MKLSAIDIGSNTVKISVFDYDGKNLTEVTRNTIPAGLIGHIENGRLTDRGLEILEDSLTRLGNFASDAGCERGSIYSFATASLRALSDFEKIKSRVLEDVGYSIELLSGDTEAELTFDALMSSTDCSRGILLDMGGGSTEVISFSGGKADFSVSLPFGALTLFRMFVKNILPTSDEYKTIFDYSREMFEKAGFIGGTPLPLYINGGSGRALAYLHSVLSGGAETSPSLPYILTKENLLKIEEGGCECDPLIKQTLLRILPTRIHTVIPAAAAILSLMDITGGDKITVTEAAIRASYIKSILNRKEGINTK